MGKDSALAVDDDEKAKKKKAKEKVKALSKKVDKTASSSKTTTTTASKSKKDSKKEDSGKKASGKKEDKKSSSSSKKHKEDGKKSSSSPKKEKTDKEKKDKEKKKSIKKEKSQADGGDDKGKVSKKKKTLHNDSTHSVESSPKKPVGIKKNTRLRRASCVQEKIKSIEMSKSRHRLDQDKKAEKKSAKKAAKEKSSLSSTTQSREEVATKARKSTTKKTKDKGDKSKEKDKKKSKSSKKEEKKSPSKSAAKSGKTDEDKSNSSSKLSSPRALPKKSITTTPTVSSAISMDKDADNDESSKSSQSSIEEEKVNAKSRLGEAVTDSTAKKNFPLDARAAAPASPRPDDKSESSVSSSSQSSQPISESKEKSSEPQSPSRGGTATTATTATPASRRPDNKSDSSVSSSSSSSSSQSSRSISLSKDKATVPQSPSRGPAATVVTASSPKRAAAQKFLAATSPQSPSRATAPAVTNSSARNKVANRYLAATAQSQSSVAPSAAITNSPARVTNRYLAATAQSPSKTAPAAVVANSPTRAANRYLAATTQSPLRAPATSSPTRTAAQKYLAATAPSHSRAATVATNSPTRATQIYLAATAQSPSKGAAAITNSPTRASQKYLAALPGANRPTKKDNDNDSLSSSSSSESSSQSSRPSGEVNTRVTSAGRLDDVEAVQKEKTPPVDVAHKVSLTGQSAPVGQEPDESSQTSTEGSAAFRKPTLSVIEDEKDAVGDPVVPKPASNAVDTEEEAVDRDASAQSLQRKGQDAAIERTLDQVDGGNSPNRHSPRSIGKTLPALKPAPYVARYNDGDKSSDSSDSSNSTTEEPVLRASRLVGRGSVGKVGDSSREEVGHETTPETAKDGSAFLKPTPPIARADENTSKRAAPEGGADDRNSQHLQSSTSVGAASKSTPVDEMDDNKSLASHSSDSESSRVETEINHSSLHMGEATQQAAPASADGKGSHDSSRVDGPLRTSHPAAVDRDEDSQSSHQEITADAAAHPNDEQSRAPSDGTTRPTISASADVNSDAAAAPAADDDDDDANDDGSTRNKIRDKNDDQSSHSSHSSRPTSRHASMQADTPTDSPGKVESIGEGNSNGLEKSPRLTPPYECKAFQELLQDCSLEVNHPDQPPVTKKGNFQQYVHSNFCLAAAEEDDDDDEDQEGEKQCLALTAHGKDGRCELRHHAHWGIAAARYSTSRAGVILCSTALCIVPSPHPSSVESLTILQIVHTSYDLPSDAVSPGESKPTQLFAKTPLLRVVWSRDDDEDDHYSLWAYVNRRNKERRYKIAPQQAGIYFDLDVWIVYDPDSENYELGIDLDEDNCLMKEIDDWLALTPTSYFQMGCSISKDNTPPGTSIQVLFRKLDINIPTGERLEEEDTDDDSDSYESDEEEESWTENVDDSDEGEEEVWEEESVSDNESSSGSSSSSDDSIDDEAGDERHWDEVSVSEEEGGDSDARSSGGDVSESELAEWAEVSASEDVSEEDVTESTRPRASRHLNYDEIWAEISVSDEENAIEHADGSMDFTEYSVESHSDITINSTGSAFYLPVDESKADGLQELADRTQIELVIARQRMVDEEDNRGYSKVTVCKDLYVSLYHAVKKACAGTRIFVLGKEVRNKLKNGDMIGYMRYGMGDNVRKVPFLTCKKTSLKAAIDEVLPVTEPVLPVLISYELVIANDDEEELSD